MDYCAFSIKYDDNTQPSKGDKTMKRETIVSMLLITVTMAVMGCAQNEVVKKDDGVVQAVTQKNAESKNDVQTQSKTTSTATTPGADTNSKQLPSAGPSSDAQKKATLLQAGIDAVYFNFDSNVLTNESRNTLQANFKMLESKPSIQIEGNCDERGSSEYNLALGEKRAKAAQDYLVTLGYPADKISTLSYGKERPADQGHDEAAWAKNRRDEFKIVK
jgi:peptidoglycan-associated lipoprotein